MDSLKFSYQAWIKESLRDTESFSAEVLIVACWKFVVCGWYVGDHFFVKGCFQNLQTACLELNVKLVLELKLL
jgi:hypothetical protein